jgi:hypothetical protein
MPQLPVVGGGVMVVRDILVIKKITPLSLIHMDTYTYKMYIIHNRRRG